MPATHTIDHELKLLITHWEGDAVDIEFNDSLQAYQKNYQNHPDYSEFNELVDFSKITSIKLTMEGLKRMGQLAATTDNQNYRRKLAFIVRSTRAYGLLNIYIAFRSRSKHANKDIKAFINEREAYEWVKIRN